MCLHFTKSVYSPRKIITSRLALIKAVLGKETQDVKMVSTFKRYCGTFDEMLPLPAFLYALMMCCCVFLFAGISTCPSVCVYCCISMSRLQCQHPPPIARRDARAGNSALPFCHRRRARAGGNVCVMSRAWRVWLERTCLSKRLWHENPLKSVSLLSFHQPASILAPPPCLLPSRPPWMVTPIVRPLLGPSLHLIFRGDAAR